MSGELDAYDAGTEVAEILPAPAQETPFDSLDWLIIGFALGTAMTFALLLTFLETWVHRLDQVGKEPAREELPLVGDASEMRP